MYSTWASSQARELSVSQAACDRERYGVVGQTEGLSPERALRGALEMLRTHTRGSVRKIEFERFSSFSSLSRPPAAALDSRSAGGGGLPPRAGARRYAVGSGTR